MGVGGRVCMGCMGCCFMTVICVGEEVLPEVARIVIFLLLFYYYAIMSMDE